MEEERIERKVMVWSDSQRFALIRFMVAASDGEGVCTVHVNVVHWLEGDVGVSIDFLCLHSSPRSSSSSFFSAAC